MSESEQSAGHADEPALASFLAERDVDCPACGYNLRGLTAERCPECRQELVLSVAMAEPPLVPYVLAVLGLASCGAAFGLMLLGVTVISMLEGSPPARAAIVFLWVPLVVIGADIALVAAFVSRAGRRWFRTRSRWSRAVVAASCWLLSLLVWGLWLALLFRMR